MVCSEGYAMLLVGLQANSALWIAEKNKNKMHYCLQLNVLGIYSTNSFVARRKGQILQYKSTRLHVARTPHKKIAKLDWELYHVLVILKYQINIFAGCCELSYGKWGRILLGCLSSTGRLHLLKGEFLFWGIG